MDVGELLGNVREYYEAAAADGGISLTATAAVEPVMAELQAHDVSRPGEKIPIDINLGRTSLFDARTEKAL